MRGHRGPCTVLVVVLGVALPASAAPTRSVALGPAAPVRMAPRLRPQVTATESTFVCFESSSLVAAINPGCFVTFEPPQPGDCSTQADQYLLQVLRPGLDAPRRLRGFSFRSNDGDTVFPAAGAFVTAASGAVALPGPAELAALQAGPFTSVTDTSWVFVDLESAGLVVPAGADSAVLVVLGFPVTGQLVAVGDGPGVCVDADPPDQDCDFFSIDAGRSWYAPAYDPEDPLSPPLDWGFVLQWAPATSVTARTWGHVKALFRTP